MSAARGGGHGKNPGGGAKKPAGPSAHRGKKAKANRPRLGDGARLAAVRAGEPAAHPKQRKSDPDAATTPPDQSRAANSAAPLADPLTQSAADPPADPPADPTADPYADPYADPPAARPAPAATGGAAPVDRAGRELFRKVRTAKGRRLSSTSWLQRQLNDPYVAAAQNEGLRSRAAFKLAEIDDRYGLFKPGQTIVDLGAAPGGWSVVAAQRVNAERWLGDPAPGAGHPGGTPGQDTATRAPSPSTAGGRATPIGQVVAVDILPMEAVTGVHTLELDFTADDAEDIVRGILRSDRIDGVLTDMAAPTTGHRQTDHLRIMDLCEIALDFACTVLGENGFFLAKMFQGGTENELLTTMKQRFKTVRHVKPPASRADSAEMYVLATGFRGSSRCTGQ